MSSEYAGMAFDAMVPDADNYTLGFRRGLKAAQEAILDQVTYGMELNYDGSEDPLIAAYVDGVHVSYDAVRGILR